VGALAIDPQNTLTVYAGTSSGVFRSTNGARSWRPFGEGLKTLTVESLAISANGKVLYAGTSGGGVFDYTLP
jgi:hypothetical protein